MVEILNPVSNSLWTPYLDGAAAGQLVLPYCLATGQAFWPPSPVSPFRTGGAVEWRPTSPDGRLIARVTYRRGFQKAFSEALPYAIGLVELAAGPRLQAHIAAADDAGSPQAGDAVRIGFAVVVAGGGPVPVLVEAS